MYLIDTNIFLEELLGQPHAEACDRFLSSLGESSPGWVSSFSLHAIEVILDRKGLRGPLGTFLQFISGHPFIHVYATTVLEEREITQVAPRLRLDFDDALQYYMARKEKLNLVTLDRDFSRIQDISVLSPDRF